MSQTRSPDHIIRMRQAMDRIDNQVRKSRQQFVQDITVDNKTSQILNLTITLEDSFDTLDKIGIQSKVTIPQNSVFTHTISNSRQNIHDQPSSDQQFKNIHIFDHNPTPWSNFNQEMKVQRENCYIRDSNIRQKDSRLHQSPPRVERKFQPFSRLEGTILNKSSGEQKASSPKQSIIKSNNYFKNKQGQTYEKEESNKQILIIPDQIQSLSFSSNIKTDHKLMIKSNVVNQFIYDSMANDQESQQINKNINESTPNRRQINMRTVQFVSSNYQTESNKIMPLSLQTQNKNNLNDHNAQNTASPQVFSYGQQTNTPLYQQNNSSINFSFSQLQPSTSKQKIVSPSNPQRVVEKIQPTKLTYTNPSPSQKRYSQAYSSRKQNISTNKINQNQSTKRNSQKRSLIEISTKLHSKSKNKSSQIVVNNRTFNNSTFSPSKKKADDLVFERQSFLKRLETDLKPAKKSNKGQLRQKSKSNYQIKTDHSRQSHRQISPRALQISERLYFRSKIKSPCQHYKRFREEQERERFNFLIKQNSFVQKYITKDEQEMLFQALRQSDESVSMWPMKIVNYTYSKIKKVNQSTYRLQG